MVNLDAIRAPLFVPADRPDRFCKAAASGTDALILDLEDAVATGAKEDAPASLATDFTDIPVLVRVNACGTKFHDTDLASVAALSPAAVILPKAEAGNLGRVVEKLLDIPIIALIETARGLADARVIAATLGVVRMAFGSIDFCSDLGCAHSREALAPARCELVLASRLAGIAGPIDGVTVRLDDIAASHDDARYARSLGMTGKLCIHPKQIGEVKRAFTPSESELAWARKVLATGDGAISLNGEFVDEPVRARAKALIAMST